MSTCSHTYYSSPNSHDWLNAMSGDKARIDPRTFEVHQIPTLAPHHSLPRRPSHRRHLKISRLEDIPRIHSPRPRRAFVVKWLQNTTAIWGNVGFDEVLENDADDLASSVCSIDEGELLPFSLEAIPPFPKQGDDNTLFGLYQRIHQHQGVFTELPDNPTLPAYVEDQYHSPRHSILDPSAYSFSSDNVSSYSENETPTKIVGKSIVSRVRKAASQGVTALRGKLGR